MTVDSMAIANPEQIAVLHHEILYDYIGVLINFIFFVDCESLPVAEGVFGDEIERGPAFALVLGKQLPPLCRCHFDVLLRLCLSMLEFLGLIFLFYDLFFDLILMFAKCTDSFLMEFLFLRIRSHKGRISKKIQIFYLHIDTYLRSLLKIGECRCVSRDLINQFIFRGKYVLRIVLEVAVLFGGVEFALLSILKVFLAEIIISGGGGKRLLALRTTGFLHSSNSSIINIKYIRTQQHTLECQDH